MRVNTAKYSGSLDCASGVTGESDPLIICLQAWPWGSPARWWDMAAWAGSHLGLRRTCFRFLFLYKCGFRWGGRWGCGGCPRLCLCLWVGLQSWCLTVTGLMLTMRGKPQLESGFLEGPWQEPRGTWGALPEGTFRSLQQDHHLSN